MIFFRFAQSAEIDYNSVWSVDPADGRGMPWGKTGEKHKRTVCGYSKGRWQTLAEGGIDILEFPSKISQKIFKRRKIKFIPYVQPVIQDVRLIIGKHSFPINFIEMITIRWKDEYGKHGAKYKIDSIYFRQFFNDTAIQELERFGM